ncbi:hypothetical protein CC2G_002213 [Coprinopsis cinerea AmutBmut pab1-1]|nr:hypothetical protein CC2G_002213 [Coprinopsis cinerea AmutBmut pab1-1]
MSAERALHAKNEGNKLFKEGKLEESVKQYELATKLDTANPVYPSNLSAALYETGQYGACVDAIFESWSRKPDEGVAKKLSARLPKALVYGLHTGTIKSTLFRDRQSEIDALKSLAAGDEVWALCGRVVSKSLENFESRALDARRRFSKLPILRGYPDPTQTFFVIGTDEVISLLDGWSEKGGVKRDQLDVKSLKPEQLERLSFLVAGVGDGKHAFGTLIGLKLARDKLSREKQAHFKPHLTLLDVHPATVARNILFFMFLDQLLEGQLTSTERLEVMTTLFYVCLGWVMPSYCWDRFLACVEDLKIRLTQTPPKLPGYIHLSLDSIPPILKALDYWLKVYVPPAKFCANITHVTGAEKISQLANVGMPGLPNPYLIRRQDVLERIGNLQPSEMMPMAAKLGHPDVKNETEARKVIVENLDELVEILTMEEFDKNFPLGLSEESKWYKETKAFVPPRAFWSRHSGLEHFGQKSLTRAKLKEIAKSIRQTWKSNMCTVDGVQSDELTGMDLDMLMTVQYFANFLTEHKLGETVDKELKKDSPSFAYAAAFFEAVLDAIRTLLPNLNIEFISGEVHQELAKIRWGADTRNPRFPKDFTRIWMSNIPDYTQGQLNLTTYVIPALQRDLPSAVGANCLFNSNVWKSDDAYCYNYTMLFPRDLERYLGLNTLDGRVVWEILSFGPSFIPKALATLPTREELSTWLTRLFLSIVHPGYVEPRPNLVKLPSTLVAFVGLLAELSNIGYPSHWISEFLQLAITNNLQADHKVFQSRLPRPVTERDQLVPLHRIRTDPWLHELETILAIANEGLPFSVQMPEGLATRHEEVGYFQAKVTRAFTYGMFYNRDAVAALVFWKRPATIRGLMPQLPKLIHREAEIAPVGTVAIFTYQDYVDLTKNEVRWRMGKSTAKKMIREQWSMAVVRMDLMMDITEPCPASRWISLA